MFVRKYNNSNKKSMDEKTSYNRQESRFCLYCYRDLEVDRKINTIIITTIATTTSKARIYKNKHMRKPTTHGINSLINVFMNMGFWPPLLRHTIVQTHFHTF